MHSTPVRILSAAVALGALLLTGCASSPPADDSDGKSLDPIETIQPSETAADSGEMLDAAAISHVVIKVYGVVTYKAKEGCGCTSETMPLPEGEEAFKRGNEVRMYRVVLTGQWAPGDEAGDTVQDVTGMSVKAHFQGQEEYAVLDENEGPHRAQAHGLPWLPEGLFGDGDWGIENDVPTSFAVAYYVPEGETHLDLSVDFPTFEHTMQLEIPLYPDKDQ